MRLKSLALFGLCLLLMGCGRSASFDPSSEIGVIVREEGSGTRGAFTELFHLTEKQGEKTQDTTTDLASVTNSTAVMLSTVSEDVGAIGYISMGSLQESVKPLAIDGVAPSQETVQRGNYPVVRPFLLVAPEQVSDLALDFESFILSDEGQAIVKEAGYIPVPSKGVYSPSSLSGQLTISGSSSVSPVMEKLKEAYEKKVPGVHIDVQQSDSSSGISDVIDGASDLAMSSRALKGSETNASIVSTPMAMDGIVIIVHPQNPIDNLSKEQVKEIFNGKITHWSDLNP